MTQGIDRVYRQCDPAKLLEPNDPRYVSCEGLRGTGDLWVVMLAHSPLDIDKWQWYSADSFEPAVRHREYLHRQVNVKALPALTPRLQHQTLEKLSALCHYPVFVRKWGRI